MATALQPVIPADIPAGTPEWWLAALEHQLKARRADLERYDRYYNGDQDLSFATAKFREAFGGLFDAFSDNWIRLVVNASAERLAVEGFRFGREAEAADRDAWGMWQANNLDADSNLAHREAIKSGEAAVIVAPPAEEGGPPVITVEHPAQVVVLFEPGSPRRRVAALKKWTDPDGKARANVYLPDAIHKFESEAPAFGLDGRLSWRSLSQDPVVEHDLGVVPVVPLRNDPTMLGGGQSDIAPVIPLQDAINKLVADMLVASEFAAFRQKVLIGAETPKDPETNEPLVDQQELRAAVSRLWVLEDPQSKTAEFAASDLSNYTRAIEMLIQHIAAQTRTPPHYLLGQSGNFPSGESLKSTETGLVAKVRDKMVTFGEAWEEVIRLGFRAIGDTERATDSRLETIWRDPESRTEGERVDALLKMRELGVPLEALWERWGATPSEIERWKNLIGLPERPPPGVPGPPTQE